MNLARSRVFVWVDGGKYEPTWMLDNESIDAILHDYEGKLINITIEEVVR